MKIKDITNENRPRERMASLGAEALSDAELLALILKTGNRNENVIDMSNRLISTYGLSKLSQCSLEELKEINGIGTAKACQILAIFEFHKRYQISMQKETPVNTAEAVYQYCFPKLSDKEQEHFAILLLDTKNKVKNYKTITIGTLNSSLIHPREVFKPAIKESANSIILVHNHPSGDCKPSKEDEKITELLIESGKTLKISVLDHVIIGKNSYYSFREQSSIQF